MSALSIAIGMVVDDSIVALENITTHIERGEKPKEAAVHGTEEVGISIIASTLTMLCVFLPLTLISGMSGIMFRQLGWIVSIIMIVSTCGALCLVPMLCSRMLRAGKKKSKLHDILFTPIDKGLNAISDGYAWVINWAVRNRKTVIFGAFGIFVAVILLLGPSIKTEYFPHADQFPSNLMPVHHRRLQVSSQETSTIESVRKSLKSKSAATRSVRPILTMRLQVCRPMVRTSYR